MLIFQIGSDTDSNPFSFWNFKVCLFANRLYRRVLGFINFEGLVWNTNYDSAEILAFILNGGKFVGGEIRASCLFCGVFNQSFNFKRLTWSAG